MSQASDIREKEGTPLARATDPEATVWVSANAGSGKTYVLSRRVIRLLLEGAKPSELLCLTFTRVAASEMANKVFEILGEWALLDEDALKQAISDLTGKPVSSKQISRARHLFATALDTPGGLRIQTIHAFCELLLHQFPLEANIPGHFDLMDETDQILLLDEARRHVILASLGAGDLRDDDTEKRQLLSEALAALQAHVSDKVIDETITQLIHQRTRFFGWLEAGGGDARSAFRDVWQEFDLSPQHTVDGLYREFVRHTALDDAGLTALKSALAASTGKTAASILDRLAQLQGSPDPMAAHTIRCGIFLKKDGEPQKWLVSEKFTVDNGLESILRSEQEILTGQIDRLKCLDVLKSSEALFTVVEAILIEYGNLKQRSGLLDFEDLIVKAVNLLGRSEIAGWIQYKLDAGIRHVLVDEAQDTSPQQWQIIKAITDEFYAGQGSEWHGGRGVRTLFVVGDEKQSIYSFQGADPEEFDQQYRRIMDKAEGSGMAQDKVPLTVSFRSTEEVLSAVDQVFSLPENSKGLFTSEPLQPHSANRQKDRGEVIIWPMEIKPVAQKREDWLAPLDSMEEQDAEVRLANKIAATIRGWIDNREVLPGRDTPIRYGDILILVRKRDRFVSAMIRALKEKELVSAGADRLKLTEHIAVEDMIALGRFAASPLDDLSLAGLLKSPLFGFSETELFDLAHGRADKTLFETIAEQALASRTLADQADGGDDRILHIHETLLSIIADAQRLPVYEFYARLFAQNELRKKYLHRLGNEVDEILDGFFQAALNYDNRSGLGLLGFAEWLAASAPELKREVDMESNEIRVITAHSSKGLEAPIVFLVDPGSKAFTTSHAPKVVYLDHSKGHGLTYPLWQARTATRIQKADGVFQKIAEKAEDEYRRLLYVGMTRAADRLVVCGYKAEKTNHDHWHSMVLKGLAAEPADPKRNGRLEPSFDPGGEPVERHWLIDNPARREKQLIQEKVARGTAREALPEWIGKAKRELTVQRPLSPSGVLSMLDITVAEEPSGLASNSDALLKGNLTHELLQALPSMATDQRPDFAERWIERSGSALDGPTRASIRNSVLAVLANPDLKPLFGSHSRAEVEITGSLVLGGTERKVRGKIDRIAISENLILLADYKTNQRVPLEPALVPDTYLAQMSLYRDLMRIVYPGKQVCPMIVWTQDASVMTLPDALLDEQISKLNNA